MSRLADTKRPRYELPLRAGWFFGKRIGSTSALRYGWTGVGAVLREPEAAPIAQIEEPTSCINTNHLDYVEDREGREHGFENSPASARQLNRRTSDLKM